MSACRIVSPYRPFPPGNHSQEGFDWIAALEMLRETAYQSMRVPVYPLTDRDTQLPGLTFTYATVERRLMLWILEVCLAYLASDDFDRDTVMLSPDTLVLGDLRPYFDGDLTILVRPLPHYAKRPVINAAQWWQVKSKPQLVNFYTQALEVARRLPHRLIRWGADCEALRVLLDPIEPGLHRRNGLLVQMCPAASVLRTVGKQALADLKRDGILPMQPIADFKYENKQYMARYFEAWRQAAMVSA